MPSSEGCDRMKQGAQWGREVEPNQPSESNAVYTTLQAPAWKGTLFKDLRISLLPHKVTWGENKNSIKKSSIK